MKTNAELQTELLQRIIRIALDDTHARQLDACIWLQERLALAMPTKNLHTMVQDDLARLRITPLSPWDAPKVTEEEIGKMLSVSIDK